MTSTRLNIIATHEGFRARLYRDSLGYWTIGYGHNVDIRDGKWCDDAVGLTLIARDFHISQDVAQVILATDITIAEADTEALLKMPLVNLEATKADALVSMAFNLGRTRLAGFRKMWAAIYAEDWNTAAAEALDSVWAKQVPRRAADIADRLRY
ncbi:MAG: glycoside hydrolase family protein [Alphaproteobacteria bacterium]|nr:glycoside hydrolase family protein [Alphaproteobacteria bacterium]